jgi:hypothetical protein
MLERDEFILPGRRAFSGGCCAKRGSIGPPGRGRACDGSLQSLPPVAKEIREDGIREAAYDLLELLGLAHKFF